MSPARADVVNAVELAGRTAELDRDLELSQLPRLQEAGALPGTRARARLSFASLEHRPTIEARVGGVIVTLCQRCLRPCECDVDEQASLMVVASDAEQVAGGFEPCIADAEHLSVQAVVEEQLLLALPLVPMHSDIAECTPDAATDARPEREDRHRPFANLRDLLDKRRS